MQTDHTVFYCHTMKKGLLVIKEVGVREPKLVCYTVVQSQVQLQLTVGQTLISPALLEIHCDGVVLRRKKVTDKETYSVVHKVKSDDGYLILAFCVAPVISC